VCFRVIDDKRRPPFTTVLIKLTPHTVYQHGGIDRCKGTLIAFTLNIL